MAKKILLASASPRRLQLLQAACFDVEVRISHADETWPKNYEGADAVGPGAIVLARRKLESIGGATDITVAADTLVVLDNQLLGKPKDATSAMGMLTKLAGQTHRVVTGFCVRLGKQKCEGAVITEVTMRPLSQAEIKRYVDLGESFDKAGGYGIQGVGGALIDHIKGSYTNVVGLPLVPVLNAISAVAP